MAREYTLIVEPIVNRLLLGKFGAVAFNPYRVDFTDEGVKCFKNDAPVAWESLPKYMTRFAHSAARQLGLTA